MQVSLDCDICNGKADLSFTRVEVWRNDKWRLTISTYREFMELLYLELIRHIENIADFAGRESLEFGNIGLLNLGP